MLILSPRCCCVSSMAVLAMAAIGIAQDPSTAPSLPVSPSTVPAPTTVPTKPSENTEPSTVPSIPSTVPSLPGAPVGPSTPTTKPNTPANPQGISATKPDAAKPVPATTKPGRADDKKKDLKPEPISLRTRDGFQLSGMYFPSDKGRKAVPVILIHEQGGQTGGYRDFAHGLQQAGFAVVYVDLRGHGASNKYLDARGNLSVWEHKGFSKRDVVAMVQSDLESVKVFLRDQNDEEKLNLNSLVLVGVGEGAIIALHWAVQDWDYPSIPGKKQGQDVKGFVLVSPAKLFGGVNYSQPLDHRIVSRLPMLIISGKGDDAIEAERIHKLQSKTRIGPSAAGVGVVDAKTLATSQSGSRLLTTPSITPVITELMVTFLNQNVVSHQDHFSWVKRSRD